jgi:ubiquinone/menaquinone biosynthesis C-methylase UbiE
MSIGSFEFIKDERQQALQEMIRVTKKGSRIGIAEPMCLQERLPADLADLDWFQSTHEYFRTVNCTLIYSVSAV